MLTFRCLLVRPPDDAPVDDYNRTESLGLGYLAAVLRQRGWDVSVLDSVLEGLGAAETAARILQADQPPDIIGFSVFGVAVRSTQAIVAALRATWPKTTIVVGGHYPTFAAGALMASVPGIDAVCRGEGEIPLARLADALGRDQDWHSIPGLVVRGSSGEVRTNPPMRRVVDLAGLPRPARDTAARLPAHRPLSVCASRGCWGRCGYCTYHPFFSLGGPPDGWIGRPPEDVVEEIRDLAVAFPSRTSLTFVDGEFFGPGEDGRERAIRIARGMDEAARGRFRFAIYCRPEDVERETFRQLRNHGLSTVYLGLESACERRSKRWSRPCSRSNALRAIDDLRSLALEIQPGFIMFDPWTTTDELRENLQFFLDADCIPLALLLRGMELRPGMPLAERLGARNDTERILAEPATMLLPDGAVREFREYLESAYGPLFGIHKQLTDLRASAAHGSPARVLADAADRRLARVVATAALAALTSSAAPDPPAPGGCTDPDPGSLLARAPTDSTAAMHAVGPTLGVVMAISFPDSPEQRGPAPVSHPPDRASHTGQPCTTFDPVAAPHGEGADRQR